MCMYTHSLYRYLLHVVAETRTAYETVCQQCPQGAGSPAKSISRTNCTCNAGFTGPAGGPCVPAANHSV